jgi:hypothetical protein
MDTATETKPPYGGFRTFWNFIGQLHDDLPLPQILDRSVMGQRGGSARSELYMALRFFGLIDGEKQPTEKLRQLTADPTKEKLGILVKTRYEPIIGLNLVTATPRQVDEALMQMGATPAIVARSRTFFLNAAEEAGIEVGKLLKTARAPTTTPRRRTRPKRVAPTGDQNGSENGGGTGTGGAVVGTLPPLIGALVAKLPPESEGWNEADAKQWLALAAPAIAYDYKLDASKLTPEGRSV